MAYPRWSSGRTVELKKRVSEEQCVIGPKEPVHNELVHVVPLPPHRFYRIFHSLQWYLGMLIEEIEKVFILGDWEYRDDPNICNEAMLDIDSEKRIWNSFSDWITLEDILWSSLWISLLMIEIIKSARISELENSFRWCDQII